MIVRRIHKIYHAEVWFPEFKRKDVVVFYPNSRENFSGHIANLQTPHGVLPLSRGCWIVTDNDGEVRVYSDDQFWEEFECL